MRVLGNSSISMGLPNYIVTLDGESMAYGLVLAIYTLTQTVFQTPLALLSDRLGRKRMVLIGMGIFLIGTILCSIATTLQQLIIFRGVQGIGAYSSILLTMITDTFSKENRSRAISYYMMSMTGGYLVGTMVGGLISEFLGMRGVFFVCAVLISLAMLAILIFLQETAPKLKMHNISRMDGTSGDLILKNIENSYDFEKFYHQIKVDECNNNKSNINKTYNNKSNLNKSYNNKSHYIKSNNNNILSKSYKKEWIFIQQKEFIFGVGMNAIRSFTISGLIAYQIWLFTQDFKLSEFNSALILLPLTLVYIGGIFSAPTLSKRFGLLRFINVASISFVVSGLFLILVNQLWFFVLLSMLGAFSLGMIDPEITTFTQSHLPIHGRGLGNGIYNTFGFLFTALGQFALPAINSLLGYSGVYGFLIGLWIFISLITYRIWKKYN